jgi:hypothetical protein
VIDGREREEPGEVFIAAMVAKGGMCPFCDRPAGEGVNGHGRFTLAWCATAWRAAGAEDRWLRAHPTAELTLRRAAPPIR